MYKQRNGEDEEVLHTYGGCDQVELPRFSEEALGG